MLQNKKKKGLQALQSKLQMNKIYSKELNQRNFKIRKKVHCIKSIVAEI